MLYNMGGFDMQLKIIKSPPDGLILSKGICFVSPHTMDILRTEMSPESQGLEFVSVTNVKGKSFICRCFSSERLGDDSSICYSPLVSLPVCIYRDEISSLKMDAVYVKPIKAAVGIRELAVTIQCDLDNHIVLKKALFRLLRGLLLSKGCRFNLNVAGRLERYPCVVNSVDFVSICGVDSDEFGFVTERTRVIFSTSEVSAAGKDLKGTEEIKTPSSSGATAVVGLEEPLLKLREVVIYPFKFPYLFESMKIDCPKGVLLYGPPGCGKTALVRSIAAEANAWLTVVNGPDVLGVHLGDAEQTLRDVFAEAKSRFMETKAPSILFIDEIDALCPKRDDNKAYESRIVAQMLTLMDGMDSIDRVVVIAATNRPDAIDPALRRPGRFDREINIGVPSREQRKAIFELYSRQVPLTEDVDFDHLAKEAVGYVGADIECVCNEAILGRIREMSLAQVKDDRKLLKGVSQSCFLKAIAKTVPSTQRGSLVNVADVTWNDIGGLSDVKHILKMAVEWPLTYASTFSRLNVSPPKGILLYGPPGCSKTTLVKAVANSCKASFLAMSGAQIYSPYVGEAEKTSKYFCTFDSFEKKKLYAHTIAIC